MVPSLTGKVLTALFWLEREVTLTLIRLCAVFLGVAYIPHAQLDRGGRGSSRRAPLVARATRAAGIGVLYIDIYIPSEPTFVPTYLPSD